MNDGRSRPAEPDEAQGPDKPLRRASGRSILMGLIAVSVFLYAVRVVLLPFVLAGVAAYAIWPLVEWLAGRFGNRRWAAALLVLLTVLAIAVAVAFFVVPQAVASVMSVGNDIHRLLDRFIASLMGKGPITVMGHSWTSTALAEQILQMADEWMGQNGRAFALAGWAFSVLSGLVLTIVIFAYFLFSGPAFGHGVFRLVPPAQREICEDIWRLSGPVLRRYFIGIACVVVYASIAAYIGLGLFLNIPDASLLAITSGLLEMVPVLGPAAAAIIAGLAAVQHATSAWGIISYVIYAVALRISIDEILGPLILGRAGKVNPTVVIFCFLAGGILFGLVGLIMSVPVALVIRVALGVLYEEPETMARLEEAR